MLDQANRTFICSVVFIDLVGYSKKPVTEQIRLKTSLTTNLSEAIKDIPVNDRIILDTGDGVAISFLGDPEDALFVTLSLREKMISEGMTSTIVEATGEDSVRMGINLGPVKLVKDINGHPNIIGDGINVAQRIRSFARPGQIVVSRSYYDVVSNLASEYAKLFHYEGSRTDKHVREHEIYVVGHHEGALQKAKDGMKDRASSTTPNQRKASATGASTVTLSMPAFVQDKKKLTMVAGGLAGLVLILGILVATKPKTAAETTVAASPPPPVVVAPQPTTPAPQTEPPKPVEIPKPDAKVLEQAPPAAAIPPAAPPAEASDKAAREVKKEGEKAARDKAAAEAASKGETKGDAQKPAVPPATLVFAITPWGEIFVNGKSRGVTPPMKSIKLDPGKYKIEVRNTTFAPHTENLDLKARDELTVRHKFQ
jgi:class 3 adenylate cyclase/outer membrane biosynthesis protein TonB